MTCQVIDSPPLEGDGDGAQPDRMARRVDPAGPTARHDECTVDRREIAVSDLNQLLGRYIAAWNEADADARGRAVAELWTEDGTYADPLVAVAGHQAIEAVIGRARELFPGHVFRLLDGVDGHHDRLQPQGTCRCRTGKASSRRYCGGTVISRSPSHTVRRRAFVT
jgi:SnoaL-like domain